jgi:hypothetical protein
MPKAKPTWTEKLHESKGFPKVEPISGSMSKRWGTGTVVIPAPIEVDKFMRQVPKGKLTTINNIREALAKKHDATIGCPMTTGIFAWIAANAAPPNNYPSERRMLRRTGVPSKQVVY